MYLRIKELFFNNAPSQMHALLFPPEHTGRKFTFQHGLFDRFSVTSHTSRAAVEGGWARWLTSCRAAQPGWLPCTGPLSNLSLAQPGKVHCSPTPAFGQSLGPCQASQDPVWPERPQGAVRTEPRSQGAGSQLALAPSDMPPAAL